VQNAKIPSSIFLVVVGLMSFGGSFHQRLLC